MGTYAIKSYLQNWRVLSINIYTQASCAQEKRLLVLQIGVRNQCHGLFNRCGLSKFKPKTARERGQVWNISLDDRIAVSIWSEMEIKRVYEGKRKETVRMLRTFEVHFRENRGATLLCKPNGIRC